MALIQRRLAELTRGLAPARVLPCPFEAVPPREAMWHPAHTHDAARMWLRETAARVGTGLGPAFLRGVNDRVGIAEKGVPDIS